MSQGYYERKKKRKKMHLIIVILCAIVVGFLVAFFQFMSRPPETEYGDIEEVEITEENIMDETQSPEREPIKVVVFDVGDALAVLVDSGQTEALYDSGYYETGKDLAKRLGKYVDGSIEYLIVSHSHADHCGGVPEIISAFEVDNVITSGETTGDSDQFDYAQDAIERSGAKVMEDDNLTFDLGNDLTMNIIETLDPGETDNPNDMSVIAYFEQKGENKILITGDAEKDAERELLGKFKDISVFVAGHHMSNTSNGYRLLADCSPEIILVSCAGPEKSEYGFPQKAALKRCLAVTRNVYATYKSGDIVVDLGDDYVINCKEEEALTLKR